MGLVDYSDSDSDSETQPQNPQPAKQAPSSSSKTAKPFQKFVSRSHPGKIVVSLPTASRADPSDQKPNDEPPAKRAKTGGGGGGRFSNFSSFLPPPKAPVKTASAQSSGSGAGKAVPPPGIHLKTGTERAFSRESISDGGFGDGGTDPGTTKGPSIHPDQKAAEDVKLVGKPLMFKPLSVARKPAKKKKTSGLVGNGASAAKSTTAPEKSPAVVEVKPAQEEPKKKISLFSIEDDSSATNPLPTPPSNGAYEPLFSTSTSDDTAVTSAYEDSYASYGQAAVAPPNQAQTLSSIADDMNLSAAERRELFGREGPGGSGPAAAAASAKVINFDMGKEYEHNEVVRASGETIVHNPVRAIAPGKHSLRQMVNSVQNNRSALEDSFAAAKGNKREAAGRYGW